MQNVSRGLKELLKLETLTNSDYEFYPVLLSKNMAPNEVKALRGSRLCFDNDCDYMLIRECCGSTLEYIFEKYG